MLETRYCTLCFGTIFENTNSNPSRFTNLNMNRRRSNGWRLGILACLEKTKCLKTIGCEWRMDTMWRWKIERQNVRFRDTTRVYDATSPAHPKRNAFGRIERPERVRGFAGFASLRRKPVRWSFAPPREQIRWARVVVITCPPETTGESGFFVRRGDVTIGLIQ